MRRTNVVNRKRTLQVVKELDAFPKVPDSYTESTASGGGISLVAILLIVALTVSEIMYYTSKEIRYSYQVDDNPNGKVKINVDMTIAMKCQMIGADVLDVTGQNAAAFGQLQEEDVHFKMDNHQQSFHDLAVHMNSYIRKEYHAMHEMLWSSGFSGKVLDMPSRSEKIEGAPDACRLHGTLEVNKVAGNFHITAGKVMPVFGMAGHAHLQFNMGDNDYNFSHRIDSLSFGDTVLGRVNPLDSDLRVTDKNYHLYQYFVKVVPTSVKIGRINMDTYQYAVTERNRVIDHGTGSHGVPGIYFKYDLSSLKVIVTEEHKPYWQFLVRLCGIVGGIFATSGMISQAMGVLVDIICCRYKVGQYKEEPSKPPPPPSPSVDLNIAPPIHNNTPLNIVPLDSTNNGIAAPINQDYNQSPQELG